VRISTKPKLWRCSVIPPRFVPEGILQLVKTDGDEKILLQQLPMSSKNRDKINKIRNDMLMVDPTLNLAIGENNSIRITRDDRVPQVHNDL
jgi:P pilus assembly chaperone PapD